MRARETCLQRRHRGARGTWVCGEHVGVVLGVDRERCDANSAWHTERFVCVLVCVMSPGAVCGLRGVFRSRVRVFDPVGRRDYFFTLQDTLT